MLRTLNRAMFTTRFKTCLFLNVTRGSCYAFQTCFPILLNSRFIVKKIIIVNLHVVHVCFFFLFFFKLRIFVLEYMVYLYVLVVYETVVSPIFTRIFVSIFWCFSNVLTV